MTKVGGWLLSSEERFRAASQLDQRLTELRLRRTGGVVCFNFPGALGGNARMSRCVTARAYALCVTPGLVPGAQRSAGSLLLKSVARALGPGDAAGASFSLRDYHA